MKKTASVILRVLSALFLCLICFLAILYQKGYYDFTFIRRPSSAPPEENAEKNAQSADSNVRDAAEEKDILVLTGSYHSENAKLCTVSEFPDWELSEKPYADGVSLLLRVEGTSLPGVFSDSEAEVRTPVRIESENGGYTTVNKVTIEPIPVLRLYMGMILEENNGELSLLDGYGNLISGRLDPSLVPAYRRTAAGEAVFKYKNGLFRCVGGLFLQIDPSDVRQTALSFDMPSDYGKDHAAISPLFDEESGKWGYADGEGNFVIEPKYDAAYAFAENGYAAVIDEGVMRFINVYGARVIDAYAETVYEQRYAVIGYYAPDTFGIESLGMYYFDHGLVRVRFHIFDRWTGKTLDDYDRLIYENGQTFPLPAGYTLLAYSDGVALLEKDGRYGFLDYTGYWIAQPLYSSASPFSEGLAPLTAGGKAGMIDTEGNVVLPFVYDYVSSCSGGLVLTWAEEGGWQIFRKSVAPG